MIATMSLSCTVSIADAGQGGPGGRPTTMGPPTSTTPRYGPPTTLPPDYCPLAGFCQNFDAMDVIDNTIYVFKGVTSCECWLLINFWLNFKTCRKTRKSVLYLVLYLCILQLRSYIFLDITEIKIEHWQKWCASLLEDLSLHRLDVFSVFVSTPDRRKICATLSLALRREILGRQNPLKIYTDFS